MNGLQMKWHGLAAVVVMLVAATVSAETAPAVNAKTEASVVEFARTHHPELANLLEQLKTNAPSEYRSAILDLEKTRDRLEKSRKNAPERADLELAEWKVNSRIRLMVARMAMGGDSSLEKDLKEALKERADLRVQLLSDERDRLRRRLEKLDENIAEQQRRASDQVEKEFAGLKRNALAASDAPKKESKPSETKKPEAKKPEAKNPDVKKLDAKKTESKKLETKPGEKSPVEKPKKTDSGKPADGEKSKPKANKP